MSWLPLWWRTRWNAITIVIRSPSWINIFSNANCAPWIFQGAFLFEFDKTQSPVYAHVYLHGGICHCHLALLK